VPREPITLEDGTVIHYYDSDHTALVHVLWGADINGEEAEELAAWIMKSKWLRAVKLHAVADSAKLP